MAKKANFKLLTVETVGEGESEQVVLIPMKGLEDADIHSTVSAINFIKKNGSKFEGKTVLVIDLKTTLKAKVTQVEPKVDLEIVE